jgi:hypothetical protein
VKKISFVILLFSIPSISMAVPPPTSIPSCVGGCSQLKQCPQDANEALIKAKEDRELAKASNKKQGAASNKTNLGKLGSSQVNPMKTAQSSTSDCTTISDNCNKSLLPISAKIEKIRGDIEKAVSKLSSCNSARQIQDDQAVQLNNELNHLFQVAKQEKAATDSEIANCTNAQKACKSLAEKNAQNANKMGDGSESAAKTEEEKKEQGGGGGGSPPGGGGGAPPPPPEKKPEEEKVPVDCTKEENILKPECKTQKCNHPQYKLMDECKVDCALPANKNHAQCTKTINPSSAKPK